MKHRHEESDSSFPEGRNHHAHPLRDLDDSQSSAPLHPRIHGVGPTALHSYTPSSSDQPVPHPDPADFPCHIGGDPTPPDQDDAAEPSVRSNPPKPRSPPPQHPQEESPRHHPDPTRIRHLTDLLAAQEADLSRLLEAYDSAISEQERMHLHLHRLEVGVCVRSSTYPSQYVQVQRYHRNFPPQVAVLMRATEDEVGRRVMQARTHVALAQQCVDDTRSELARLRRRATKATPSTDWK